MYDYKRAKPKEANRRMPGPLPSINSTSKAWRSDFILL